MQKPSESRTEAAALAEDLLRKGIALLRHGRHRKAVEEFDLLIMRFDTLDGFGSLVEAARTYRLACDV